MQRIILLGLLLTTLFLDSCLRPPPKAEPDSWTKIEGLTTINNIRNIYAAPTELYLISNDEFIRLDVQNNPVEKRKLQLPFRYYGRPGLSENTFFQMIRNADGQQELNFYLTKNAGPIYKIEINDFLGSEDNGFLAVPSSRNTAAYNATGTQFLLPVTQLPDSYYTFFLFDIRLNSNKTEFESIDLAYRIDMPDLPADGDNLINIKYIKGFYYASSLDGAVRIDPVSGEAVKIFDDWLLDFFAYENKIYGTGFGNLLYVSSDNGVSWEQVDMAIDLEMVDVVNNQVFTQRGTGFPYSMSDGDLETITPLKLNKDFPNDFSAYQDFTYFYGRYYLSVFKELYFATELVLEEE